MQAPTVNETYEFEGKTMVRNTEFAITDEPGARFRFLRHVVLADGREWIDCLGGQPKVTMWRSFRPARIRTITKLVPPPVRPK